MLSRHTDLNLAWSSCLERVREELVALSDAEKQWLQGRLTTIGRLQAELDGLFHKAGGLTACSECDGECCGCGKHHITLTNLLTFLLADELPPEPDFRNTCPFLGPTGCLLPVTCRPYNCITFFCEQLEHGLDTESQELLRQLDRQLRGEYLVVAERYPAASLRGLWISLERLDEDQVLHSPADHAKM